MTFKNDVLNHFGIELSETQERQFSVYFSELIEYNKHTNLTRITDEQDVYYKHFFDSISILKISDISLVNTFCDMGAGAGFPSIPIKILFPHLKITIIDSLNKRINFLQILIEKLQLNDIVLVHDRIENFAINNQNQFDIVTARALGALPLILELGIPMLKLNSHFIAYKSNTYEEELKLSKKALSVLGSSVCQIEEFSLPMNLGDRALIKIIKNKQINGYPRSFATIVKKPL